MRWYDKGIHALVAGALAAVIAWCGSASAQGFSVTITVDENCNGTLTNTLGFEGALPCSPATATGGIDYGLLGPPGLTFGTLVLDEPGGEVGSDFILFTELNGGSLGFFSDATDGIDSLADSILQPVLIEPLIIMTEVGPEGANGFTYTPIAGQPGFVAGAAGPVSYVILSDSVPEPATLALLGIGLAGLGFSRRARKH